MKSKEEKKKYHREWQIKNSEYLREWRKKWSKTEAGKKYSKYQTEYHRKWLETEAGKRYSIALRKKRMTKVRKKYLECQHKWRIKNPEYQREWIKTEAGEKHLSSQRENPKYRLNNSIASSIRHALKKEKAGRRWEILVGYTLKDLANHLESLFDDKMSWQNYGSYWWIDHIKPKSLFNYTMAEDSEFKKCWALANLQPMEKIANISKGNKYQLVN